MANNKVRPTTYSNCKLCENGTELRLSLFNCRYNIPPVTNCIDRKINCVLFKKNIGIHMLLNIYGKELVSIF